MNKWILVAALAGLGASGGASAQIRHFYPYGSEGCGSANTPQCEQVRPNYWAGMPHYYPYHPYDNPYRHDGYALQQPPFVIADGRYYATPYPPTRRDRDGDGVRNSRDRYPDDPRYR